MTPTNGTYVMKKSEICVRLVDESNIELIEKFLPTTNPARATRNDILNYNILKFKEAINKYGETSEYALLFSSRGAVKSSYIPLNEARNLLAFMAADFYFACGIVKLLRGESHK